MLSEYKSPQKQHYHCVATYYNDMGHFLIKIDWEADTPEDVMQSAKDPIEVFIYKLAKSHTTEHYDKIPGTRWSTRYFKAKQPMTSHEFELGEFRFYIVVAWGS